MANLTEAFGEAEVFGADEHRVPVAASTKIFGGSIVCRDANGYATFGQDAANLEFMGIALEKQVDNSAGANGAKNVKIRSGNFFFKAKGSGLAQADVGDPVFVGGDPATVTVAPGSHSVHVGWISEFISATRVIVQAKPWGIIGRPVNTWAITNHTPDVAIDCDTVAVAELADAFGSLVLELVNSGVLKGSVA